jgi:hypothetical protein
MVGSAIAAFFAPIASALTAISAGINASNVPSAMMTSLSAAVDPPVYGWAPQLVAVCASIRRSEAASIAAVDS